MTVLSHQIVVAFIFHRPDRYTPMSLPRRAMEQMGFSICCLTCDAPDIPGTERCKGCIESHARARDKLTTGPATTKAERLAREQVTMLADPNKYIDDNDHGDFMLNYLRLIDSHRGIEEVITMEQVEARFAAQRSKKDKSLIREVANQNQWTKKAPDADERKEMLEIFGEAKSPDVPSWDDLLEEVGELLDED